MAYEKGKFEGFVVGKDVVHVSLLQFADDTLIFCKYDDDMLENLRKTIEIFEWCSGQKINWKKYALCGINIDDNKLIPTATSLNCKVESPHFLPRITSWRISQKRSFWQPVIGKIKDKLEKWKRFNLSRGGRVNFANRPLSSTYVLHVFILNAGKGDFKYRESDEELLLGRPQVER